MIEVFRVYLVGEPLLLAEGLQELGFYRNEYVASSSEGRAIAAAKVKTMERLGSQGVKFIDGRPLVLRVEEVEGGMPLWRLLRNEGFIFFDVNS